MNEDAAEEQVRALGGGWAQGRWPQGGGGLLGLSQSCGRMSRSAPSLVVPCTRLFTLVSLIFSLDEEDKA